MDEYKNYIYARDPQRYENVQTGDISYQLAVKESLQCKPFSYFINTVAEDMLEYYPLVDPPPFAKGVVSSYDFRVNKISTNFPTFHRYKVSSDQRIAWTITAKKRKHNLAYTTVLKISPTRKLASSSSLDIIETLNLREQCSASIKIVKEHW